MLFDLTVKHMARWIKKKLLHTTWVVRALWLVVTNDLLEYRHTDDTEALYMKENPLHTRLWLLCTFLSSAVYDWTDTWEHTIHLLKLILGTLSNDDNGSDTFLKKWICVLSNLIKVNLLGRSKYAQLKISGLQIDWLVQIWARMCCGSIFILGLIFIFLCFWL